MKSTFEWESDYIQFILHQMNCLINKCTTCEHRNEALCISESLPFKGHLLHVCTKTKFGLLKEDMFKYSPEYFSKVPIRFVSVQNEPLKLF